MGPEGKVRRGSGRIKAWGSAAFDLPPPPPALGSNSSKRLPGQLHPGLKPRDGDPGEGAVGTQLCPTSAQAPAHRPSVTSLWTPQPSQLSCAQPEEANPPLTSPPPCRLLEGLKVGKDLKPRAKGWMRFVPQSLLPTHQPFPGEPGCLEGMG